MLIILNYKKKETSSNISTPLEIPKKTELSNEQNILETNHRSSSEAQTLPQPINGGFCGQRSWRRILTGLLLSFFQQVSGITAVLFFSNHIFISTSEGTEEEKEMVAKKLTVGIGVLLMIASLMSGKLIDRFGRKTILALGVGVIDFTLLII